MPTPTPLILNKTDLFIPLWQLIAVNLSGTPLTAPTDATTPLPSTWSQLGSLGDEGVVMTPAKTRAPIKQAQFGAQVANPVTDSSLAFKGTCNELNLNVFKTAFGAAVTEASGGGTLAINPGATSGALQTVIEAYDAAGRCVRDYFPAAEAGVDGDIPIAVTGTLRSIPLTWDAYTDSANFAVYEFQSWLVTGAV